MDGCEFDSLYDDMMERYMYDTRCKSPCGLLDPKSLTDAPQYVPTNAGNA